MTGPEARLKAAIARELPREAFARQPAWAALAAPLLLAIAALSGLLVCAPLPGYVAVPGALLLGLLYASLTFLGHEVAHGVALRPGALREAITYAAFALYCISPELWRNWHHRAHHAHTNMAGRDPDNFGTLEEFRRDGWWCRLLYRLAPGIGHGGCLAVIFLFFFFTLQGQGMLWSKAKHLPDFAGLRRRRAVIDTAALAAFWLAVAVLAGPRGALLVVLIPMFVANAAVTSYIVTTHMLCPLASRPDTLRTTMGVTTLRALDVLQFHFSHHLEHHLFPGMCSRYYPLVRASLRRHLGEAFFAPVHWRALVAIARTPRVYDGPETLVDPFSGVRIGIAQVRARLLTATRAET